MKKALKITGIVIGVLVLLLIVTGLALPFLLNPNHFKPEIAQAVKDRTGRALNIEGDIKFSIFPWLGAQIGPMELANAPGFGGAPFAAINETDVHVHFWPLLHGDIEVGEVKLDGLSLDMERDANGRNNWQDLSEHLAGPASGTSSGNKGGAAGLSVAGLAITNGQVRWQDAQKHQQYTISNFGLTLGAFTPGQPTSVESAFDLAGTNPELHGHADFRGTLTADLAHRIYSADEAKLNLQLSGSPVPGGQVQSALSWQHTALNMDNGSAALNGLDLSAYGMSLHLEAQGKGLNEHGQFTGSVKLDSFSPRDVLKTLGMAEFANTRDATALSHAGGGFSFEANSNAVALSELNLQLDDTRLTGKAGIKDFKNTALSFDMNVDQLDADRYLPVRRSAEATGVTAAASIGAKPREELDINKVGLPLRTLRRLNLDGHVHLGRFTLFNTHVGDFDVDLSAHQGLIRIDPLSASLYGGNVAGSFIVDASDLTADSATVTEKLDLKGVQINGLAKDLADMNRLSGELNLESSTRAEGRLVAELRSTLSGRLSFDLKQGALEGVNVTDAVLQAYAAAKGQAAPPAAPDRTEFADLHGSGAIRNGVLNNKDFAARLPFLELTGEGKLDLVDLTVDYNLKGRFTATPKVPNLGELKGNALPIHISGTLSNLSVHPDLGGMAKAKLDEGLDKKKAELKKKLQDKLKDSSGSG